MSSLKSKIVHGLFWSFLDSFGVYFIRFGFSITIARILSPEDYGLIGMVAFFIAIATMITESGFQMALIQKKNANQTDYSTIFYFNVFIAIVTYLIIYICAGSISNFYNEPKLTEITRVLSISIILGSLITVQYTLLLKKMDFKKQTFINLGAVVFSGTAGVVLAIKGYAVWALVFQTLIGSFIRVVAYWIVNKWRPSFIFSIKSFKSLFHYGYKIFLQGLSDTILSNIYYPIIGKMFSTSELGYYTNADRFYQIFVRRITISYSRVTFPAFSLIQDQRERFVNSYIKSYRLIAFILFPLMAVLIVSAKPFVSFFLTEKWLPIVPYMKLLYIEGFFFPLLLLNLNIFNALGKSGTSLLVDLIKKILLVISIFITYRYGISGLIVGMLISSFIAFVISGFFIQKVIKYKVTYQFKELVPIILSTIPCYFVCVFFLKKIDSNLIIMFLQFFSTIIIYFLIVRSFKLLAYNDIILLIDKYIPSKLKRLF